jgi:amino acid transporter
MQDGRLTEPDLSEAAKAADTAAPAGLRRVIGLPLLVLYGLGVTIGAGIYVLVGETAARAGVYAPSAFLLSAVVMGFSAASFAEFSGRIPEAAGEAVYVDAGFGRGWLTLATGGLIVFAALIAAAAISLGAAGYLRMLLPLPQPAAVVLIVLGMGGLAAWGIRESVTFAGVMTLIEVAGLAVIIGAGFLREPDLLLHLPEALPAPGDGAALAGVFSASLVAFFAFIGFDDTVNLVEETREPRRTMPWAILITLVAVTVLYLLVAFVAVRAIPLDELAASRAPVALMFERLTGLSPASITLIAIVATLNGVVIQIIMAARVLYGLARKGRLPALLSRVHPRTQTPAAATVAVTGSVLALALFVPLDRLAEATSTVILVVFTLVNLALLRLKRRGVPAPAGVFTVPAAIPAIGAVSCAGLLAGALVFG